VIARGINDAKASIVVWSANSVVSDWVKEEAELAKGAGKYLPVQIGTDLPPMGFRRIQAADLRNWNGNAQDPQWRMLMVEAANLVRGNLAPPPPVPAPAPPPALDFAPAPVSIGAKKKLLIGLAAVASALIAGGLWNPAGWSALSRHNTPGGVTAASNSVVGYWSGWGDPIPPGPKIQWYATFRADGTVLGQNAAGAVLGVAPWTQSGSTVRWSNGAIIWTATIDGNKMTGRFDYAQHTGSFDGTR
jgi:hypothetical protein